MGKMTVCLHQLDASNVTGLDACRSVVSATVGELRAMLHVTRIALVLMDLDRPDALEAVRHAAALSGMPPIVGVTGSNDLNLGIAAQRAGCAHLARKPVALAELPQLVSVNQKDEAQVSQVQPASPEGQVVVVIGSMGGAGASTFACYLTMELAELQGKAAIMDLDLEFGRVAAAWDLEPQYTIADLVQAGTIDACITEDVMVELPGHVGVLARPSRVEQAETIDTVHVQQILATLRKMYPTTVVDVPRKLDAMAGCAVEQCDRLIIVTQLSVGGVANAGRLVDALRAVGFPHEKIDFVINRYTKKMHRVSIEAMEDRVGKKILGMVPNHYKSLSIAVDMGQPVGNRNPVRRAVADLAARICGQHEASSRSWLPRLSLTGK